MQGTANADLVAKNLQIVQEKKAVRAEADALAEQVKLKDAQIAELEKLVRYYRKIRRAQYDKRRMMDETAHMIWVAGAVVVGLQAVSYLLFEAWLAFRAFMG